MENFQGLKEEEKDGSNPLNPGNFQNVKLIPDGACLFTRGMGMSCTWEKERGFGERSWRYSAVINDGKLEKIFVEVKRPPATLIPPPPPPHQRRLPIPACSLPADDPLRRPVSASGCASRRGRALSRGIIYPPSRGESHGVSEPFPPVG